jgi:hypothetical protein
MQPPFWFYKNSILYTAFYYVFKFYEIVFAINSKKKVVQKSRGKFSTSNNVHKVLHGNTQAKIEVILKKK